MSPGDARDEVDRAADCAGSEDRRRAAAQRFDALDRLVDAHELIGVVERQLEHRIERNAVFHQADVAIAAVLNDAAREHVALRRAGSGLDPEARHRGNQIRRARRRLLRDVLGIERGDRDARIELGALGDGRAGDDDFAHREELVRTGLTLRRCAHPVAPPPVAGRCIARESHRSAQAGSTVPPPRRSDAARRLSLRPC